MTGVPTCALPICRWGGGESGGLTFFLAAKGKTLTNTSLGAVVAGPVSLLFTFLKTLYSFILMVRSVSLPGALAPSQYWPKDHHRVLRSPESG